MCGRADAARQRTKRPNGAVTPGIFSANARPTAPVLTTMELETIDERASIGVCWVVDRMEGSLNRAQPVFKEVDWMARVVPRSAG